MFARARWASRSLCTGAPTLLFRQASARLCLSARSEHGHSHDGVACGHSHGPPAESEGSEHGHSHGATPEPVEEQSGLPLEQRAKNILVGNWRAQLTTIVAEKRAGCAAMLSAKYPFFLFKIINLAS